MAGLIYHFGLTGYPLGHSLSPRIHLAALRSAGLAGDYKLFPLKSSSSLEQLLVLLRQGGLHGLNVTIPHKQSVLALVDLFSHTARMSGAINTLYMRADQLVGDNTDVSGFMTDLYEKIGSGFAKKNVLVLGAGGAARAVVIGLLSAGWRVVVSAREAERAHNLVEQLRPWSRKEHLQALSLKKEVLNDAMESFGLLVNTTSAGMAPQLLVDPLPEEVEFPRDLLLYDLVYNPANTVLMQRFQLAGNIAYNGLGMLVEQAARSFELWTGMHVSREDLWRALDEEK